MSSALSTKKARTFEDGTTPPAQPYSVQNLRGSIAQSSAGDSLPHMSKAEKRVPKTRLPSDCAAGTRARTLDTTQWHTDNCGKHTCHANMQLQTCLAYKRTRHSWIPLRAQQRFTPQPAHSSSFEAVVSTGLRSRKFAFAIDVCMCRLAIAQLAGHVIGYRKDKLKHF